MVLRGRVTALSLVVVHRSKSWQLTFAICVLYMTTSHLEDALMTPIEFM